MAERKGPFCGADRRNDKGSCRQPAGWHTSHEGVGRCSWHGGNAPSGVKAAERQRLEDEAARVLAQLDVPPCEDPLTELQKLAGQVLAWRDAIAGLVNALTAVRYAGEHGEQLRAEVALYERALDRTERVLVAMARLDLDERLVRINEATGKLILGVLLGAAQDVGLAAEVQQALRPAIARRLRATAREDREQVRVALPAGAAPEGRHSLRFP